jgi:hypothetical protein
MFLGQGVPQDHDENCQDDHSIDRHLRRTRGRERRGRESWRPGGWNTGRPWRGRKKEGYGDACYERSCPRYAPAELDCRNTSKRPPQHRNTWFPSTLLAR